MATKRRSFLKSSAAAGVGASLLGLLPPARSAQSGAKSGSSRRLLILGGTAFLGPQLVESARDLGYTITLFNRGKTNPGLFPDLEKLHGDRNGDLKSLEGRKWDAVVDTSGYVPRHVRDSATLLADAVKQYIFISSISVYSDNSKPGMDEAAAVGKLDDETVEKVTGETYGPLKVLCEKAAEAAMPGRVTVIRPGLIVGPGDPTDRFTYWPVRVDRGGEVLAPGTPSDPVQFIDVRDLAAWSMRCARDGVTGVFNATGPKSELSMGTMLDTCKRASKSKATLTWVPADFLEEHKVSAWADMPCWVPPTGEMAGFARVSCARALAKGLTFRPLAETTKDTLAWWTARPKDKQTEPGAGIQPAREREVLDAWHARDTKKRAK